MKNRKGFLNTFQTRPQGRRSGTVDEAACPNGEEDVRSSPPPSLWRSRESRKLSDCFDAAYYLETNPDVRESGMDPLEHYIAFGKAEGRKPTKQAAEQAHSEALPKGGRKPIDDFDAAYYLERNPDVKRCGMDPLEHYIRHGKAEGRMPSKQAEEKAHLHALLEGNLKVFFDAEYYLGRYPDLKNSGVDPLEHYIKHGKAEGRKPTRDLENKAASFERTNITAYFPDDKKRVFVLSHELSLTGAPLVLVQAVRILRQNGWQVVVASPEDGAVARDFVRLGVPVLILGDLDRNDSWMQMAANFDLVLVNTIVPYRQIQMLGEMDVPVLWWLHDARAGYEEALQYVLPETVGRNIHIYAVSRYAEKVVTDYRPGYSAALLPYGLKDDAPKYQNCEDPFADDPRAVFLSVGTITPRKGQDILAEAIRKLPDELRKQCRFLFIGKEIDRSIYRDLLQLKERFPEEVELLGEMPHDELPPYFAHAAAVICSSRDDPLPTFMTETMMMSGVCICSEHTGTAALIEPGKNGFLYRNNDPDELAECIRQVLACGDTKSLRQEARKTYENVFSEEIFEKNILRSVADCMGETKKARGDKKMDYLSIKTFSDVLSLMEREYSERVAFRWVDDDENTQQKTYHDFCADIRRGISCLHKTVGDAEDRHVAILAQNSYDYAVMLFACLVAGVVVVPLNLQKSAEEILAELADSDTDIVFHDGEFIDREEGFTALFGGRLLPLGEYAHYDGDASWDEPSPSALSAIFYTSGTTARSKGVMLSHRSLFASASSMAINDYCRSVSNKPDDHPVAWLIALPFYHLGGFGPLRSALIEGCIANLNGNTKYFLRDMKLLPSDICFISPIYLDMICKKLRRGSKAFLGGMNVLCVSGAPVSFDTLRALKAHDIDILQIYGLTEAFSPVVMNFSQDESHISSIGKLLSHPLDARIKIMDDELCIAGDSIMMGYYKNPEETAKVIDAEGWLHTGDLVRQDGDGYYYIIGRKKNLIILSGGENINPEEIEEKLYADPDILEVIVKEKNNRIAAEIFCEEPKKQAIEAFVTELNQTLPTYKFIAEVEFRDTPFERTALGKIKRQAVMLSAKGASK